MEVPLLGNLELKCESSRLKISRTVTQWLGRTSDQRLRKQDPNLFPCSFHLGNGWVLLLFLLTSQQLALNGMIHAVQPRLRDAFLSSLGAEIQGQPFQRVSSRSQALSKGAESSQPCLLAGTKNHPIIQQKLVGGIPTPPKHMKVNWDDYSQYMGK